MKVLIPLAIREKMKIGTLLINIDRFRAVNDEHGDEFGDEFLKLYANTIKDTIRSSDIAVRFAGGEFLVLLVNVDSELRTIEIADKLREKLAQTYLITKNGDQFKKSVCIGVSMFPEDSSNIDEVIKKAQDAVSDARDNGRNITKRFESSEGMIDLF
jgi:diguanylate cyclase (GGDEF)-like protein